MQNRGDEDISDGVREEGMKLKKNQKITLMVFGDWLLEGSISYFSTMFYTNCIKLLVLYYYIHTSIMLPCSLAKLINLSEYKLPVGKEKVKSYFSFCSVPYSIEWLNYLSKCSCQKLKSYTLYNFLLHLWD